MELSSGSGASGIPHVDAALHNLIETFENAFPHRIRGYYVHGSVADRTSIATSDVDIDIVVKGEFKDEGEHAAFVQAAHAVATSSALEVEIDITDEVTLSSGAEPTFKIGSRLLYGEDIRPHMPLVPIDEWGRERMFRGYFLLVRVFHRPSPVRYPIGFPDPDAEFYGYTNRRVHLADGSHVPSTRDLIRVTGWLATALVAYEGKRYVARKRDCHRLYAEVFHDEWSCLLEEIYGTCRGKWGCLIPDSPSDWDQLRSSCERVLAFENHFLACFKPFVLQELRRTTRGEESRARWLMQEIPFEDDEVLRAL